MKKKDWTEKALSLIREERYRQEQVFGGRENNDLEWLSILVEEVGEVVKDLNSMRDSRDGYRKREVSKNFTLELVQVGAVVTAWLEEVLQRD